MSGKQHLLNIEIIPDPELGRFTARVPDIPAFGEGNTEEQAIADLHEALQAYIESFGLDDALSLVVDKISVRQVDINLADLARG